MLPCWAEKNLEARGISDPRALWDSNLEGPEAYRAALHSVGMKTRSEERAAQERNSRQMDAGEEVSRLLRENGAESVLSWIRGHESATVRADEARLALESFKASPPAPVAPPVPAPIPPVGEASPPAWSDISRALRYGESIGIRFDCIRAAEAWALSFIRSGRLE